MKGEVSILEAISTIIILFIAFNIFFPKFSYQSKWDMATLLLKERDVLITLDRIGRLYQYSFDAAALASFLTKAIPEKNVIYWSQVEGTIKPTIVVACNCTEEQIVKLYEWGEYLRVNDRSVKILVCPTNLDHINPCYTGPDVLLIWGYKDLTNYKEVFKRFLSAGKGILEIMDLPSQVDSTQREIFGIVECSALPPISCGWSTVTEDSFLVPGSARQRNYQPYKYFYHIPISLKAEESVIVIPLDRGTPPCISRNINKGDIEFRDNSYNFWICDGKSVYFDTDGNNRADTIVRPGDNFRIAGYNFYLSYIVDNERIGVTFKPDFEFVDFLKFDGGTRVYPIDRKKERIVLHRGNYSDRTAPIPVVIVNGTVGRTAWVADFTRDGLNIGDDHRQLLFSLLFFVSNKGATNVLSMPFKEGYFTSYIHTVGDDMYEIYKINLGLGYPR